MTPSEAPMRSDNNIMRRMAGALVLVCTASGQSILDASKAPLLPKYFERSAGEKKLQCEVRPVAPRLNYSFRVQAGYIAHVPMKQYFGKGHRLAFATRVTPEGRDPVYLIDGVNLPDVPKNKAVWDLGGSFLVGEGRYRVDWLMGDDSNRVCRKSWNFEVKPATQARNIKMLAPGAVEEISLRRWPAADATPGANRIERITVLLHAAPIMTRSTRLRAQDRFILLESLAALLESLPARSVRLVVFSLDQQKELYRQDVLKPEHFAAIGQSMRNLRLQVVDYQVLKNRTGHLDLLSDLLSQELNAAEPPDAVIFLGPTARYSDKFPYAITETRNTAAPHFFYLEFKPPWNRGDEFPDSIDFALRKVKGKTMLVHSPEEFAKAIRQIEAQMPPGN
jgi:hypothetical protein